MLRFIEFMVVLFGTHLLTGLLMGDKATFVVATGLFLLYYFIKFILYLLIKKL